MGSVSASPSDVGLAKPSGRLDALDGVRAVAVLLVIAFHVRLPGMSGGFLGVDVFFVLSGYLITKLLLRDLQIYGRVRLSTFWARRVRRLMPAFLLLVLAVTAWAATTAPAYQRESLRGDTIASMLYVANWHFIGQSSYFADDGSESPLQHVWSLAVEEQFYVVWPLIITVIAVVVARRRAARPATPGELSTAGLIGATALVLGIASLVLLAALYDPTAPERAYMGTDARAVEPLLGAWLAVALGTGQATRFLRQRGRVVAVVGLAAVAVCVAMLGSDEGAVSAYYRGGALALSLGTIAVVASVSTMTAPLGMLAILGSAPLAYLGRISYGVYLWHWPLVVWLLAADGFSASRAALVVALSVAIAAASYHLVELPIRQGRLSHWLVPRRLVPISVLAVAASIGTASAAVQPAVETGGSRGVLMVGDSVPSRLMPALAVEADARDLVVTSAARGSCPALGVSIVNDDGSPQTADLDCAKEVPPLQSEAVAADDPAVVVWWSRYELSDRLGKSGERLRAGTEEFWAQQRRDLAQAARRLTAGGAELVLVRTDRPGIGMYSRCTDSDCHSFLRRLLDQDDLRVAWNDYLTAFAKRNPSAHVISIDDAFCHDDAVPCDDSLADGTPARPDGSHFSEEAMPEVAAALLDRVIAATDGPKPVS